MLFVAEIKDNVLGLCTPVDSYEDGIALVKEIVANNGVTLTDEVIDDINDCWDYYEDDWSVTLADMS